MSEVSAAPMQESVCLSLSHREWQAIMATIDGDRSDIDLALDALVRWAPSSWFPNDDNNNDETGGKDGTE